MTKIKETVDEIITLIVRVERGFEKDATLVVKCVPQTSLRRLT